MSGNIAAPLSPWQCDSRPGKQPSMLEQTTDRLLVLVPAVLVALFLALGLTVLLRPWLARHAMATPNARSSHRAPTPQGGGIAVVAATLLVGWAAYALLPALVANPSRQFVTVTAAAMLLALVG